MSLPTMDILTAAALDADVRGSLPVLILLANYANYQTGEAWPSQNKIAKSLGISRQAVSQHIEKLREKGFLEVERRHSEHSGAETSCLYRLKLPNDTPQVQLAPPQATLAPPASLELAPPPQATLAPINLSILELTKGTSTPSGASGSLFALENQQGEAASEKQNPAAGKKAGAYTEGFELFWQSYPRNPNMPKRDAFKAWQRLIREGALPKDIMAGLAGYKTNIASEGTAPRYIAHASTFLNQRRYEGYLEAGQPQAETEAPPEWSQALDLARQKGNEHSAAAIIAAVKTGDYDAANRIAKEYLTSLQPSPPTAQQRREAITR